MNRIRVNEIVVVEGKYDAIALSNLIDGLIIATDGFSIFSDDDKKALIRRLGRQRGLIILTDSDAAGFRIRHYVEKITQGCRVRHVYIPAVPGKEKRKSMPSKEGMLGVEGMPAELLREALHLAGVEVEAAAGTPITHTDLYELGLSGAPGSATRRRQMLTRMGLPPRLSKRALCQVLSCLYTREELLQFAEQKPALFWDFHGTLTLPDHNWANVTLDLAERLAPGCGLTRDKLREHLSGKCLPWFTTPNGDTRHLTEAGRWWAYCEEEFRQMLLRCGLSAEAAAIIAKQVRGEVLNPQRYTLYPDAVATLTALQNRGYRNYILSNNFPELSRVVEALGLAECVEGVLVSGRIGYEKPHPGLFEYAKRIAGVRQPWMIGDNPVDDIAGGAACGFVTVAAHQAGGDADYHIDMLAEILDILP